MSSSDRDDDLASGVSRLHTRWPRRSGQAQLFRHVVSVIEGPDRELRVEPCASHLPGLASMRHVLRAEPVAPASIDQLVTWIGSQLDRYLHRPV